MIKNKKVLAIIPARIGSKRLRKKNIYKFNNKPLIYWTIKSAINSKYIDRVIVSTDDKYISNLSKFYGAEVPFLRPKKLALDNSSTSEVVIHLLKKLKVRNNNIIILLQPTSPLRTTSQIDEAIDLFRKKNFLENLVSITKLNHPVEWAIELTDNLSLKNSNHLNSKRSQEFTQKYILNGSIYILNVRAFLKEKRFILKKKSYGFLMDKKTSIDIDNLEDLKLAEYYFKSKDIFSV